MALEYIQKKVMISFAVAEATYQDGDWGQAFTNGGAGEIDWDTPRSGRVPLITGQTPIADGIATVTIEVFVDVPGTWKFGVKVRDRFNNEQVGDSIEAEAYIDLTPLYPGRLSGESFDFENSELVLGL